MSKQILHMKTITNLNPISTLICLQQISEIYLNSDSERKKKIIWKPVRNGTPNISKKEIRDLFYHFGVRWMGKVKVWLRNWWKFYRRTLVSSAGLLQALEDFHVEKIWEFSNIRGVFTYRNLLYERSYWMK